MARGTPRDRPNRKYCVTAHGHADTGGARAVWETFQLFEVGKDNVRHAFGQLEKGGDSGLLHLQAYIEFDRPVRFAHVKRLLSDPAAHLTPADGSAEQNHDYCGKEETREEGPFSLGVPGGKQGKRSDIDRIQTLLQEGADNRTLWLEEFKGMVRIFKAVDRYRQETRVPSPFSSVTVNVYWGDTGLGKTRRAVSEADGRAHGYCKVDVPDKIGCAKWFDGYTGQGTIIIDDFHGEYAVNFLKRLLDGYDMLLPVKGCFVPRACTHIVITSNHPPDRWYPEIPIEDFEAIKRRFTSVVHFTSPWVPE